MDYGDSFNPFGQFIGLFIPNCIARSNLSDQAKLLLGRLFQYSGRDGKAYPKREKLAKELHWKLSKLDRIIKQLKQFELIRTFQVDENSPSTYVFLYHKMYEFSEGDDATKFDKGAVTKSNKRAAVKFSKHKNKVFKNKKTKDLDKSKSCPSDNSKKGDVVYKKIIISKASLLKKKSLPKEEKIVAPKKQSKYKWTDRDHKYLLWIQSEFNKAKEKSKHLVTEHLESSKVYIDMMDNIHALFANNCAIPYQFANNVTDEYISKKWEIDEVLDTFAYHVENSQLGSPERIKAFGKFIFTPGFNGGKSWSPLIHWHQRMNKTDDSLTEAGFKLFKSMKNAKITGAENLESSILNNVSAELETLKGTYSLFDGADISSTSPLGLISCFVRYVKHRANNISFHLVYIRGKTFIPSFIEDAEKNNIIKRRKAVRR